METSRTSPRPVSDAITVIAIACIAYILATALHEHVGHALACVALGGRLRELNAFYVDCDYQQMPNLNIRLVAFAGPLMSLLTGIIALAAFRRLPDASSYLRLFLWVLGTIGLLVATGYLLFSGLSGLGDFGTSREGMLYNLAPEWLWRVIITVLGIGGYALSVRASLAAMEQLIGGSGPDRVKRAQRISLTCYLAGGLVSVLIGLLNPQGLFIVLASAGAASLGGTSALAWSMQQLDRKRETTQPPLQIARNWLWIGVGIVVVAVYGVILGPSIKP